jgi:protoporphyrinogen oxidase
MNRKMWATDLDALDACWVRHCSGSSKPNVADVSPGKLLLNFVLDRADPGWQPHTRVSYPARGGTGAIWTGLAGKLAPGRLLTGIRVIRIWSRAKLLELADGSVWRYRQLISSAPLDLLLEMIVDRPDLTQHGSRLRRSSCALIGFGMRGQAPKWLHSVHGLHVPQVDVPFWRLSFPKNMSPGNVPGDRYWSVLCEVSAAAELGAPDLDLLARQTKAGLIRLRILPQASQVVSRWATWLKHGYPVPFLGRTKVLAQLLPELKAMGILSRGRFGAWLYEASNQDHAFFQGVEAADCVLEGRNENLFTS